MTVKGFVESGDFFYKQQTQNIHQANPNQRIPSAVPEDVRRNMNTINEIQRINQLNRKQH